MSQKLLDSAKDLVTNFQLKYAKSSEILLKKSVILTWLNETYEVCKITIFCLVLALSKHQLRMPILANTLFGPQFSITQHFDLLSNATAAYLFLYDTQFLTISFKWLQIYMQ